MKLSLSNSRSPVAVLCSGRCPTLEQSRRGDFSSYHLHSLGKSIQEKKNMNSKIREQLKMQRESSQKLLGQIKSSMLQTQRNGVDFITRYQEQKHKYECLQQLVSHYQKQISEQKLKQYHNTMSNIQNNEYDQLRNVLQEREKQLQAITNKLNVSECQKKTKYQIVKCERRERTIFSNQFNPFEKELFDIQYQYKQQLIERALLEMEFENQKKQFQNLQLKSNRDLQTIQIHSHHLHQHYILNRDTHNINRDTHNINMDAHNINRDTHTIVPSQFYSCNIKLNPSSYGNKSRINCIKIDKNQITSKNELYQQRNQKKINNLQHLKTTKNILNDFGVNSTKELYQIFTQTYRNQEDKIVVIQQLNEQKAASIQVLEDEIYEWDKQLDQLIFKIQHQPESVKPSSSQRQSLKRVNEILALINSMNQQINIQKQEISKFNRSQNVQTLIKLLDLPSQQQRQTQQFENENQPDRIDANLMQKIEKKFTQIIGHLPSFKNKSRNINKCKSLFWQSPTSKHQQKGSSLMITQKSICPLLQPSRVYHNAKRMKNEISQQIGGQNGLKKLSNLLKNQSRMRVHIDVASKNQMIRDANETFDSEGISRIQKYQVNYS